MKCTLRLFAAARQYAEADSIEFELADGSSVGDLRAALLARLPMLESLASHLRFAVNSDYATDETVICEQDEIACIPPVSGG